MRGNSGLAGSILGELLFAAGAGAAEGLLLCRACREGSNGKRDVVLAVFAAAEHPAPQSLDRLREKLAPVGITLTAGGALSANADANAVAKNTPAEAPQPQASSP